ncbi:MAG TPA: hydrogenase formation protein HypD [Armatimonadota bacterium]|nr:hydrogenase formation protein HypD [Armatimonadota bacterium]
MSVAAGPTIALEALVSDCRELAARAAQRIGGPAHLMEVCGTHSHAIAHAGIRQAIGEDLRLVSGPGCPVCVTAARQIDLALAIAGRDDTILVTFGDMVRVPGTEASLAEVRAAGGQVRVVYSPMDCIQLAKENPDREIVMVAVGFETTVPTIALMLQAARKAGIGNLSILDAHKLVPPAMHALMAEEGVNLHGFICPGHVSVVIGSDAYHAVAETHRIPCVVAGFEPLDILLAVRGLLGQVARGDADVENAYGRAVTEAGNRRAVEAIYSVFEVGEASWRGIGIIPDSGLRLREDWAEFDVLNRLDLQVSEAKEHPACHCGDMLRGRLLPKECPVFGKSCTPDKPLGPCMVSSEGACAAEYRYRSA